MDGVHDLGGMHGFGPVVLEEGEPVFHADWERRALALTLATGALGRWTIDRSRHVRESLPPALYLGSSYYEIWLRGLDRLLAESGLLDTGRAADIDDGLRPGAAPPAPAAVPWPTLRESLERGSPYEREADAPARFAVGRRVRTLVMHPSGHTRLPRYARGKVGQVVAVRGAHVFPDRNAAPDAAGAAPGPTRAQAPPTSSPEWLYTVAFDGRELFGADADPTVTVTIDAFEPYLRPAAAADDVENRGTA